jgi:hypothetical protein
MKITITFTVETNESANKEDIIRDMEEMKAECEKNKLEPWMKSQAVEYKIED